MDKLDSLQLKEDTKHTPEEIKILQEYFEDESESENYLGVNWKMVGYATLIFILLANPWIDTAFEKVSFLGSNPISIFAVKVVLFFILFAVVYKFAC